MIRNNGNLVKNSYYTTKDFGAQANQPQRNNVSFKNGAAIGGFWPYLCNNDGVHTAFVDVAAMVIPRTAIDATRNPTCAHETFFREIYGTIINCLSPGFLALGIAYLFKSNKTGIDTTIWANNGSINTLEHFWDKSNKKLENFIGDVLTNTSVLKGEESKSFSKEAIDSHSIKIADLIKNKELNSKQVKEQTGKIVDSLAKTIGARDSVTVKHEFEYSTSLNHLVRDIVDVSKSVFANEKVADSKKAIAHLRKANYTKTGFSLAIIGSLLYACQFLNRYLTQKRTGKTVFPGSCEFNNSNQVKEKSDNKKNPVSFTGGLTDGVKKFFRNGGLEFVHEYPSLNQLRLLYGVSIAGRLHAVRNNDEKRETLIRDSLGYANWLVIGGFVSKAVALFNNKPDEGLELINGKKPVEGDSLLTKAKKFFWDMNVKSFEELHDHAHVFTEDTFKNPAAKESILRKYLSSESAEKVLSSAIEDTSLIKKEMAENLFKKLKSVKNIAMWSGFAYSFVALGATVPLFNKYLTNKKNKEKLNKVCQPATNISFGNDQKRVFKNFIEKTNSFNKANA